MKAVVIGAGLGGLSCGIHLLKKGFEVVIYEKNAASGGRANRLEEKGFKIDMGPTLVLMPEVLEGVFQTAGRKLSDHIDLRKLDPGYRIFFPGGRHFDMVDHLPRLVEQIGAFEPSLPAGQAGAPGRFEAFRRDVESKFTCSRRVFIERSFESIFDVVNLESLKSFFKIKPFGNAWDHAYGYFKNAELATVFSCQALYLGDSPFRVPALYNLLAYVEFTHGIWFPMGGMKAVPDALERIFKELGGTLKLESEVDSVAIEKGRARGVRFKNGRLDKADVVVSNRDLPASYFYFVESGQRPSVPDSRIRGWHYGSSCVLYYLGLRRKIEGLFHHNIFISNDYRKSCDEIFVEEVLPEEPLLYVCCPTKTDPSLAPEGKEAVYILALAPNLRNAEEKPDYDAFRTKVLLRLAASGVDIRPEDIELERIFTPRHFESMYGSFYGNAFGLAPDFLQSACFRPFSKSRDVKGLYHTGASTHPGSGIPMVLTSGRLVADQVARDFGGRR